MCEYGPIRLLPGSTPALQPTSGGVRRLMALRSLLTVGLLCWLSGISHAQDQFVRVVLTRYRQVQPGICELTAMESRSIGSIRLFCPMSSGAIAGRRILTQTENDTLIDLALNSNAYGGDATGLDEREGDGPFETVEVQCCQRRDVIVLVATG